jgi:hypothetical protein
MIHKLGTTKDLISLQLLNPDVRKIIENDLTILDENYGSDRDVNKDNGGYVLYCTSGTKKEELKEHLDYTEYSPEFVDLISGFCHAVYVLSIEYAVSIIISIHDAPQEMKNEI